MICGSNKFWPFLVDNSTVALKPRSPRSHIAPSRFVPVSWHFRFPCARPCAPMHPSAHACVSMCVSMCVNVCVCCLLRPAPSQRHIPCALGRRKKCQGVCPCECVTLYVSLCVLLRLCPLCLTIDACEQVVAVCLQHRWQGGRRDAGTYRLASMQQRCRLGLMTTLRIRSWTPLRGICMRIYSFLEKSYRQASWANRKLSTT